MVLVELLLRKKPIFIDESGLHQNLAYYFLEQFKGRQIREIISPQVLEETTEEEIDDVCSLVEACLRLRGDERPTMREVEATLQLLRAKRLTDAAKGPCQPPSVDFGARANLASEDGYSYRSLEQECLSSIDLPR